MWELIALLVIKYASNALLQILDIPDGYRYVADGCLPLTTCKAKAREQGQSLLTIVVLHLENIHSACDSAPVIKVAT